MHPINTKNIRINVTLAYNTRIHYGLQFMNKNLNINGCN